MLYRLKHDEMDTFKATESQDLFFNVFDAGHVTLAAKKTVGTFAQCCRPEQAPEYDSIIYICVCICNLQG